MSDKKDNAFDLTSTIVLAYVESGGANPELVPWLFDNLYESIKDKLAAEKKAEPRSLPGQP